MRAALGDAGFEQVAVRQQVGGHERAVAVAAHADARGVGHSHLGGLVDGGFGVGHDLLDVGVVDRVGVSPTTGMAALSSTAKPSSTWKSCE